MGRHTRFGKRHNGQSQREKRQTKLIKVVRMVNPENSSEIAGVIRELDDDNILPSIRDVPNKHPVYVLDPRIVRKEFQHGFQVGWNARKAIDDIQSTTEDETGDKLKGVKLGKVVMLGANCHKKIVCCYLDSRELSAERRAIYAVLGDNGVRGFNKKEHRTPPAPLIVLAHFDQPVHDPDRQSEIAEVITDAFAIHRVSPIELGPAIVTTRD